MARVRYDHLKMDTEFMEPMLDRSDSNLFGEANVDKIKHELGWEAKYTDLHESLTHAWKFRKTKGDTWES